MELSFPGTFTILELSFLRTFALKNQSSKKIQSQEYSLSVTFATMNKSTKNAPVLVLGTGIRIGQYYWVLGTG